MADQVPLVSKRTAALGTLVRLLARLRRDVVGVVVEVDVPLQQLLLPERLVAVLADVRLLVGVDQHVRLQVALRDGRVRTQVALETLLALVGLAVQLKCEEEASGCGQKHGSETLLETRYRNANGG